MGRDARTTSRGALGVVPLMPVAAFAVHQLRFYLAFGSGAGAELMRTGHSYLHSVVPWVVLLIALSAGGFVWRLGRACAGQRSLPRYTASLFGLWATCSACLIALFVCQEFLEGLFATGHPGGLAGIFGFGGWWSVPVSLAIGLVLATLAHGALWVLDAVARRRAGARVLRVNRPARAVAPAVVLIAPLAPLVGGWSDRGPPR